MMHTYIYIILLNLIVIHVLQQTLLPWQMVHFTQWILITHSYAYPEL